VDDWLEQAGDALAREARVDPASLRLDDNDAGLLLELAGLAAHESGARLNAPLVCFLAGRAAASGRRVEELVDAVKALPGKGSRVER
jgi:hypothetical protein